MQLSNPLEAIGYIKTPYGQKFAVPRQPGLVDSINIIEFYKPYDDPQAFIGLEGFSHIHVIFYFHEIEYKKFTPMVRPPRLGGNKKIGVFACRSPFRPSKLGLSILELLKIENHEGSCRLIVKGADLVSGTPIIDIKPYIPFVDCIPNAKGGFALLKPPTKKVIFSERILNNLAKYKDINFNVLEQILSQDPRPAYKGLHEDNKEYVAKIFDRNIIFKVENDGVFVIDIEDKNE